MANDMEYGTMDPTRQGGGSSRGAPSTGGYTPRYTEGGMAWNSLGNLRDQNIQPQNQTLWNNYLTANDLGRQQQSDLMGGYQNLAQNAGGMFNPAYQGFSGLAFGNAGGFDPQFRGGLSSALGGYQNFADTGGFTGQNIQDIRARGVAPLRAVYANANKDVNRQRSLQGGYSPNLTAAKAKMSRDLGYGLADASTNIEANLAEQIRSGKLAGLQGVAGTSAQGQGLQNAIDAMNAQTKLQGLSGMGQMANAMGNMQLGAMGGASDVYRSAPGLANMAGNQMLTSSGQLVDTQGLQNQLALGIMQNDTNRAAQGGAWNKFKDIMGMVPGFGGLLGRIFPGGGSPGGGSQIPPDIQGTSGIPGMPRYPGPF